MVFRVTCEGDIAEIQIVRNSVHENVLSNPALVSDADCKDYILFRGRGWVCEVEGRIVGFAIADLVGHNIWALFIHPEFEGRGIGKQLQNLMLAWYFCQTSEPVWLSTEPKSRAEGFYRFFGWKDIGFHGKGEIKFQMSHEDWLGMGEH